MKTKMFELYDGFNDESGYSLTQVIVFEKEYEWEDIKAVIDDVNCDEDCDNKYDEIMYQLEQHFGKFETLKIYDTEFLAEL